MKNIGLYVHIPFCVRKCPYCDFYSVKGNDSEYDFYTSEAEKKITAWGEKLRRNADTLYFGGGTPSIMGAERLVRLSKTAVSSFGGDISEITAEVNPAKEDFDFETLRKGGFNRISIGLQSADDKELSELGRLHDSSAAERCIKKARLSGFDNISLDLMLAVPKQTKESLRKSVEFCAVNGAKHISAYILKIEEGTPFFKKRQSLDLPDDDGQADIYEYACEFMNEYGYHQYEISNFAKEGFESRHNLKYWHCEEYIGIGPSAHSFFDGRRFYCQRDMTSFLKDQFTDDGQGGTPEEYIMLGLRLTEGINFEKFRNRFGYDIPEEYISRAEYFSKYGLMNVSDKKISLTQKGFLVSNAVIGEILSS